MIGSILLFHIVSIWK